MNWLTHLALISCCFACAANTGEKSELAKSKNVGVDQFSKLREVKTNVVLDVRTPAEFQAGHIPGAVNIDWNGVDFTRKIDALDKTKTYLVYCASGGRSARACDKMSTLGFSNLYNLEGGIKAWQRAGKLVER